MEQLNYRLDQQLNESFRKQLASTSSASPGQSSSDHYEELEEELEDPECNISKFELFKYLSLMQCSLHDQKIESLYPEFNVDATIRSLILFVNLKRFPADFYVKPSLKLCLKNTIDSIQIAGDQKPIRLLFTIELSNLSLFRYLTFLILEFGEHMIEPVDLQLNELICLRHLEIYGRKFNFRKAKCHNAQLSNLIVHDKPVDFCVLDLFPNLVLIRIAHQSGDLLKCTSKQERQLRVVSLPSLSLADLSYLVANCKKVELIECELIYPQMVGYLKMLPRLKFVFLILKKEQRKMARAIAYLLYFQLGALLKEPFYYSNQLYCPRDYEGNPRNVPCFKSDCPNCSNISTSNKWASLQSLNEHLIKKKMKKDCRPADEGVLACVASGLSKINVFSRRKKKPANDSSWSLKGKTSPTNRTKKSTSLDSLRSFDRFLSSPKEQQTADRSRLTKQVTLQGPSRPPPVQRLIYLDYFKLNRSNLDTFSCLSEIEFKDANHQRIRVSELNRLVNLIGLDMMKERLFKADLIEIDESISLSKGELKKLSALIAYSSGLHVKALDLSTFDYLIKQMPYVRTIEFDNVQIDQMMSSYLANNWANPLKYLQKFSLHSDQVANGNCFRFLLECDSLSELRLINVSFDADVIAGVLTKNTNCCNIELSKVLSEVDQRKIVEVVSFNALVNKSLNFDLKLAKSQYLGIDLLSNLKIKA